MLNREQLLKELKSKQAAIVYESNEDEGAAEYHGEIQSVIDAIEAGKTDEEIIEARAWVSV